MRRKTNFTFPKKKAKYQKQFDEAQAAYDKSNEYQVKENTLGLERAIKRSKPERLTFPSVIEWLPTYFRTFNLDQKLRPFIGGLIVGFLLIPQSLALDF